MSISIVIALIVIMLLTCIIGLLVSGQETSSHVQTLQKDIDEIENLLPQTQCRDCGFNGCRPYAEAIANRVADINRCLPGGIETIRSLSVRTGLDVKPLYKKTDKYNEPQIAFIHEEHCIGCVKCIAACPVDAIVGAPKQMHSVINAYCTGCELCIAPCPVDCISMIPA